MTENVSPRVNQADLMKEVAKKTDLIVEMTRLAFNAGQPQLDVFMTVDSTVRDEMVRLLDTDLCSELSQFHVQVKSDTDSRRHIRITIDFISADRWSATYG